MEKKELLWKKIKNLALTELCSESPGLYGAVTRSFEQWEENSESGTNGETFYYSAETFLSLFQKQGIKGVNRSFLHSLFHLLYLHVNLFTEKSWESAEEEELWNLACDIVSEYTIDCLERPELTGSMTEEEQSFCSRLWQKETCLSTEAVYQKLREQNLSDGERRELKQCFFKDSHIFWKPMKTEKIEQLGEVLRGITLYDSKAGAAGSSIRGTEAGNQQEWYELQAKRQRDYHKFLREFMVEREEIQLDIESFDYIPYMYGIARYKNLPILEPLEYTETRKLEELVIAIDTSSSCTREVVQQFLEETYGVLSRQEYFFRKIRVHIIQCDCYVQEDAVITCEKEWKKYLKQIQIKGRGGTDFRPVFRHIETLREKGELTDLKALLYFTDGDGIYPVRKPDYESVFLLTKEPPREANVPAWAKILYMDERKQGDRIL